MQDFSHPQSNYTCQSTSRNLRKITRRGNKKVFPPHLPCLILPVKIISWGTSFTQAGNGGLQDSITSFQLQFILKTHTPPRAVPAPIQAPKGQPSSPTGCFSSPQLLSSEHSVNNGSIGKYVVDAIGNRGGRAQPSKSLRVCETSGHKPHIPIGKLQLLVIPPFLGRFWGRGCFSGTVSRRGRTMEC